MNHAGDAAEQIVKMSLEGVEVAAKITGAAAKEIALLLIAALKSDKKGSLKLRGRERLNTMLKSGKPLEIYSLKERDLAKFAQGAKEYGVVYCVLRNTKNNPDGLCDIMVRADDAPKISRLIERFNFATVDRARIESEIVNERADRVAEVRAGDTPGAEPESPDVGDTEKLIDDLLGTSERKAEPDVPEAEKSEPVKAESAKVEAEVSDSRPLTLDGSEPPPPPSEPISEPKRNSGKDTLSKPSVKEEIREIKASRKEKEADKPRRDDPVVHSKPKENPTTTHTQPQRSGKTKSTKTKGSR